MTPQRTDGYLLHPQTGHWVLVSRPSKMSLLVNLLVLIGIQTQPRWALAKKRLQIVIVTVYIFLGLPGKR